MKDELKPDIFMPFYWPTFWTAVKAWPYVAIVGYQKALTHYWFHLECKGLKDDAESLRKICELDKDEWEVCVELIFDNDKFFKQDAKGLWRQKKADEVWAEAQKRMSNIKKASAAGVAKRRAIGQIPPPNRKK